MWSFVFSCGTSTWIQIKCARRLTSDLLLLACNSTTTHHQPLMHGCLSMIVLPDVEKIIEALLLSYIDWNYSTYSLEVTELY